MKQLFFYNSLIVIALLASCKKIDIQPTEGDPVFTAAAELNGTPHEWQAGVEDYYLYTAWEKDAANVHVFTGRFAQTTGCCGETLTFHIWDFQQLAQGNPAIDESLNPDLDFGFVFYETADTSLTISSDTIGWAVNFDASSSSIPFGNGEYTWDFGDGNTIQTQNPDIAHIYDSTWFAQTVPVKLTVKSSNQSTYLGSLTRNLFLGPQSQTADPCNVFLAVSNPSFPEITATATGQPPFSYLWSTGETSQTVVADSNFIALFVTVTDAQGCSVSAEVNSFYSPGTVPPIYIAQFDYSLTPVVVPDTVVQVFPADSLFFSKVVIEYTDTNGELFSSAFRQQEAAAYFDILSVEDYDVNENGEKTKKLALRFDCRLWDAAGNPIDLKAGQAVIAVAYP